MENSRRRTTRLNAGVPPNRMGYSEMSVPTNEVLKTLNKSIQSGSMNCETHSSRSSSASNPSTIRVGNRRQTSIQPSRPSSARTKTTGSSSLSRKNQIKVLKARIKAAELQIKLAELEAAEDSDDSQILDDDEEGSDVTRYILPEIAASTAPVVEDWVASTVSSDLDAELPGQRTNTNLNPDINTKALADNNAKENNGDESKEKLCNNQLSTINLGKEIAKGITEGFQHLQQSYITNCVSGSDTVSKLLTRQSVGRELPHFSGLPEEWLQFITQYQQTTEMCGFKNFENLSRLQKCLKGKALETVQPMLNLPENVDEVIKVLEQTFGQPALIVMSLIEKAKTSASPRSSQPETIVAFSNGVRNMVKTLEALRCFDDLRNPQLLRELAAKLPESLQRQWCKIAISLPAEELDLTSFSLWLSDEAKIANLQTYLKSSWSTPDNRAEKRSKTNTTEVVFGHTVTKPERKYRPCSVCSKDHRVTDCPQFLMLSLEEKWKQATANNLCFSCLIPGHRATECRKKLICGEKGCKEPHHKMLHKRDSDADPTFCHHVTANHTKVLLRIIPVRLNGPKGAVVVYALLDEGSTVTLMESQLAKQLGLHGPSEELCVQWTHGVVRRTPSSQKVSVGISGISSGAKPFKMLNVRTVDDMCLPSQSINMEQFVQNWPYLKSANFATIDNVRPRVLIGQDNILLTAPRKVIHGSWNSPVATRTWLGWVVHGTSTVSGVVDSAVTLHLCHHPDDALNNINRMVKDSFTLENVGVKVSSSSLLSKEDIRSNAILQSTTCRKGERWETGLLWRCKDIVTPDSKPTALRRLDCLERRMDRDSEFASRYCEKIEDLISKKYVRKLSTFEVYQRSPREWYLPHFGVTNPNKPGKLRVVFDLAAKTRGVSLNDYLMTGPDLLNSLPAVLWRFRKFRYAFASDIKEMFLRVLLTPEDTQSQRFFWRGMDRDRAPDVYVFDVVVFGSTCSPASANFVKIKNAEEFSDEFPVAYDMVVRQSYMDDFMGGGDSEEETIKIVHELIEIHRRGGFELCNWTSNSKTVLHKIPSELKSKEVKDLSPDSPIPIERVLGLWWDPQMDHFTYKTNFHKVPASILNGSLVPTKRQVLQLVMSIYDPIGFLAYFIIKGKILLQDIWKSNIDWDDKLKDELASKWRTWLAELQQITEIKIPRHYSINIPNSDAINIHMFCDASEKAYAVVGYLTVHATHGVDVSFLAGKARVAPLKNLSIPRMELQAALCSARLAATLQRELEITINRTYFWTDSTTVLGWIRSETKRPDQFVGNRIGEIIELTNVTDWRYIPTKDNVADDGTRDSKRCDFTNTSRWFSGPPFLKLDEDGWPKQDMKTSKSKINPIEFVALSTEPRWDDLLLNKCSSWKKLIRVTAWILKFLKNCRRTNQNTHSYLTIDELNSAELYWTRKAQYDSFPLEIIALKKSKQDSIERSSKLFKLSPSLNEDGLLVLQGRVDLALTLSERARRPVILDPNHRYTQLLIEEFHVRMHHQGQETIANELRQRFWILRLRIAIKRCVRHCQKCIRKSCKPVIPEMGQLPSFRFEKKIRPFTFTGMDFFGPIAVKCGKKLEKRYGVIFTCFTIRAIHLEMAETLKTESAINAIRRFISRRGHPKEIWSDNGPNLRGADEELKKAVALLNSDAIPSEMSTKINWRFNPPASPHMGGTWERLIRSVKTALRASLSGIVPKVDTLQTFLTEIESVINSRPLTHVSVDPADPESLTPNHFLLGSSNGSSSPGAFDESNFTLRNQWKWAQMLTERFWKRWVKEYLPTLTRRTKWFQPCKPLQIDDLVIVADDKLPRNVWPMGRITNVYPGKDGQVRVVDVKIKDGIFRRSVIHLCKLDVDQKD